MPDVPTAEEIQALDDPAERLIHAGARLLIDDGFRMLAAGLSPEAVTSVAGRTRRTFYDHYETKEEYTRAMLLLYLEIDKQGIRTGDFEDAFAGLILEADGDIVTSIRSLTEAFFTIGAASDSPQMQAIAWTMAHRDPVIANKLQLYAGEVDARYAKLIHQALTLWGLKLRPPWTPLLLTTSLRSMTAGLYARTRMGSEVVDHKFVADNILAFLSALTQPIHRPDETLDTAFRRASQSSSASWRESQDPQTAVNTRRKVLGVVAPLLAELGMSKVSLGHIAHAAGVSEATVSAAFPSVEEAIGQAVLQSLPALQREATFDLETEGLSCRAVLSRHFARLAGWVTTNREFAAYSLGAVSEHLENSAQTTWNQAPGATMTLIRSTAEPAVEILAQAASRNQVRADADTLDVAVLATHAVMGRAILNPGYEPTRIADWMVRLILDGIAARPATDRAEARNS